MLHSIPRLYYDGYSFIYSEYRANIKGLTCTKKKKKKEK